MKEEKDLNYIVKLERAIKKKYGEEAIQNPANFWNEEKERLYLQQLAEFVEKQKKFESNLEPENVNGILITRKLLNRERKVNCSNCGKRLKTINDDMYMIKFECCEMCFIKNLEDRGSDEDSEQNHGELENVKKST